MNILFFSPLSGDILNATTMIEKLEKYGGEHAHVIETVSEGGAQGDYRTLIFVFHEPDSLMDVTVLVFSGLYRHADSLAGTFYGDTKAKAIEGKQYLDMIRSMSSDWYQPLINTALDTDRKMSDRKDAIETLITDGSGVLSYFL